MKPGSNMIDSLRTQNFSNTTPTLPQSQNVTISSFVQSQAIFSLTKLVEKNNIYDIKLLLLDLLVNIFP